MAGPHKPLIAIVGTTGTGKSRLAVDLAKRFNGEVINADAMQLYQGLPIITNKIPFEEQEGIPHHLLDCVNLIEPPWRVGKWVAEAIETIKVIHDKQKIPIVVGGTHYYVQSLLFPDSISLQPEENDISNGRNPTYEEWLNLTTEELMSKLREIDPVMAKRWHPNERRKIWRSLEIWLQTGKRPSELYKEQAKQRACAKEPKGFPFQDDPEMTGTSEPQDHLTTSYNLRYSTLVLWARTDREILFKRLDDRVNAMIESGLVKEVQELNRLERNLVGTGHTLDKTSGIFASIGFRHFQNYVAISESEGLDSIAAKKELTESTKRTQVANRHYSKNQLRWIRVKLYNALSNSGASDQMRVLDTSVLREWDDLVLKPAQSLVDAFLSGKDLSEVQSKSNFAETAVAMGQPYDFSQRQDLWVSHDCDVCGMTVVTDKQWSIHLQSKGHRNAMKRQRRNQHLMGKEVP